MKKELRHELEKIGQAIFLSEDLQKIMEQSDEAHKEVILEAFVHYVKQIKSNRSHPDPAGVAAGVHDAVDKSVEFTKKTHPKASEISCRQGCSHCCHLHVGITLPEAELLVRYAESQAIEIDEEKLQKQAGRNLRAWRDLHKEERACVFLQDDSCSVYEHRPTACRKLHVVTPPEHCDAVLLHGMKVGRLASVEAEIIFSASMSMQTQGSMADMLLKALQLKKQRDSIVQLIAPAKGA